MFQTTKRCAAVLATMVVVAGLAANASAGPRRGTLHDVHRVLAGSSDSFREVFEGGSTATVIINGDGDTDLDLYVYDQNGNLIGSDTDSSDTCVVNWTPRWTGEFRIVVVNLGQVYNEYTITAR